MTQIERRQARIRRIREQLNSSTNPKAAVDVEATTPPNARYHIGKSQNEPEHITAFIQKNAGDPAVKVKPNFYQPVLYFLMHDLE